MMKLKKRSSFFNRCASIIFYQPTEYNQAGHFHQKKDKHQLSTSNAKTQRINILPEDIYRKIAAGEVIDRPYSIVRELLDNALDAGSSELNIHLEEGGLTRIRIIDNGIGMSPADLEICFLPHTTSKIKAESDLFNIRTLGFRGEALSSIAVCSRLEITSMTSDAESAYNLQVKEGRLEQLNPCQGQPGTVVDVSNLFYNMPARKHFLKSITAETNLCRAVLLDKALAYPAVTFRFFVNRKLNLYLPPQSLQARIEQAYATLLQGGLLATTPEIKGEGFSLQVVLSEPGFSRRDRKLLQIFVNTRRIYEYALQQAVEYAYTEYLPGGNFPAAFVFLTIDPAEVDFNIHPAKREVRFKQLNPVHHALVTGIQSYLKGYNLTDSLHKPDIPRKEFEPATFTFSEKDFLAPATAVHSEIPVFQRQTTEPQNKSAAQPVLPVALFSDSSDHFGQSPLAQPSGYGRYLGQCLGLFLLVEASDCLYLIDQHAAHERLLYEQLLQKQANRPIQELLFPIAFDVSPTEKTFLEARIKELSDLGITVEQVGLYSFAVHALPEKWQEVGEAELIELIKNDGLSLSEFEHALYSSLACKWAIKDGEAIDPATAQFLIKGVFALPNARCPHGRPIFIKLDRDKLYKMFGRT